MDINHVFGVANTEGGLEQYFRQFGIIGIDPGQGDARVKKLMGMIAEDNRYFVMMSYSGPHGFYGYNTMMSVMGPVKEKAIEYFSKLEQKVAIEFSEPPDVIKNDQESIIDILKKASNKDQN